MDNELESLAAELARLKPVAPSPRLQRRLAGELAAGNPRRLRTWWFGAVALPIAAAVALAILLPRESSPTTTPRATAASANTDTLKPIAAENVLYAARDEGIVTLGDGTPARRERFKYVDTITWQNPRTHASLTWSVPREEVRVVPVRYQ